MRKLIIPLILLAVLNLGASSVFSGKVILSGKQTHNREYVDYCADANTLLCLRMNVNGHGKLINDTPFTYVGIGAGATFTDDGSCQEGNCYSFNGTTNNFSFGDVAQVDTFTNFSMCAWVYHDSLTNDDWIMGKSNGSFTDGWFFFRDDSGGGETDGYKMGVGENGSSDSVNNNTVTNSSVVDTWTHVCTTFEATSATGSNIYINGVLDANSPVDCSDVAGFNSGATNLLIGQAADGGRNFAGAIDEMLLIERVLTADEVLDIFTNGLK